MKAIITDLFQNFNPIWNTILNFFTNFNLEKMSALVTFIGGLIAIYTFYKSIQKKNRKSKLYLDSKRESEHLIDRDKIFVDVIKLISSNTKIIELNGPSGIGKTFFLKFFHDIVNGKLSRKFIRNKSLKYFVKKMKEYKVFYEQINRNEKFEDFIKRISKNCFGDNFSSEYSHFSTQIHEFLKAKKVILIFDNVDNISYHDELNKFIKAFFNHKNSDDIIIIGSKIKFNYISKNEKILLKFFENNEIVELYKVYNNYAPKEVEAIKVHTQGLPLHIDMYAQTPDSSLEKTFDEKTKDKFKRLNESQKEVFISILVIAAFRTKVKGDILEYLSLNNLKNNLHSLISFNFIKENNNHYLVQELVLFSLLNYIKLASSYIPILDKIIIKIMNYNFELKEKKDTLFHIFLQLHLSKKIESKEVMSKKNILDAIDFKIARNEYLEILIIGKYFFELNSNINGRYLLKDSKFYLELIKRYICALEYSGEFNKALEALDKLRIDYKFYRVTEIETESEFDFFYMYANVTHLQNNYQNAINDFEILKEQAKKLKFEKYYLKTLYQIAHNERHCGTNLKRSIDYYVETIHEAERKNNEEFFFRGSIGEISIHIIQDNINFRYPEKFETLFEKVEKLDSNSDIRAYVYKYYGRYQLRKNKMSLACDYFNKAEKIYKENESRKINFLNFDWAEYHRAMKNFEEANFYYDKCISFGNNQNDKNLVVYSKVGKLIINCNLLSKEEVIAECNNLIISANNINSNTIKYQIELLKFYADDYFEDKIDSYINYYQHLGLNREVELLNKMFSDDFDINQFTLNLA